MRHKKQKFALNRFTSWRRATVLSLARSLLKYQRLKTTIIKAKATQPLVEKIIALAKKNTLAQKRRVYQLLRDHKSVSLLFSDIAPRFQNRSSGFTRILKLANRRGDNAQMVIFELTEIKEKKLKVKAEKEAKPEVKPELKSAEETRPIKENKLSEKPPVIKKPAKNFLGGLRNIFKKKSDSL
jgi:large subunit ribosomal protein L17